MMLIYPKVRDSFVASILYSHLADVALEIYLNQEYRTFQFGLRHETNPPVYLYSWRQQENLLFNPGSIN